MCAEGIPRARLGTPGGQGGHAREAGNGSRPINIYLFNVVKYKSEKYELLINSAITAANNKTKPLAASNLKNHLNGDDKYLSIF